MKARNTSPRVPRNVLWPRDAAAYFGISDKSLWRWEQMGWLPPRDVHVGSRSGWKIATIEQAATRERPPP